MKKFIKGCLIAGLICIFIGGGITATSVALGGNIIDVLPKRAVEWKQELGNVVQEEFWSDEFWDEDFPFDSDFEDLTDQGQQIYAGSGIKELGVVIAAGKVSVKDDAPGEEITIFCNRDNSYYNVEEDNGELKLKGYSGGDEDDDDLLFTIHIPKDYRFSNVDLKLKRSRFSGRDKYNSEVALIADAISSDEINLEAQGGSIKVTQANAGDLSMSTQAGAVNFSGTTTGDITAKCQAGAIKLGLDGEKKDYNYDIRCKLGTIKLGDEGFSVLASGEQINNEAGKDMDLDCEAGAVQVSFMNQV